MGERKGQNFYYPPDFNYKVHKNLNKYHGTHALRERASKIGEGILTIRFEMPFNVWCLGCNNHVGMGVRYNAEKKKIGMYYTTPLYEFRMKCHLCDNYFTIRTDPKNFDYEMVDGLRRQEIRFDPSTVDNLAPVDRTFNLKLSADAMYKTEHMVEDKKKLQTADGQIERLEAIQSRLYDDYRANCVLRNTFRMEKKDLNEKRIKDIDLKTRLSTEIPLLPETKEDRIAAARILQYKDIGSFEDREKSRKDDVLNRPIFDGEGQSNSPKTTTISPKKLLLKNAKRRNNGDLLNFDQNTAGGKMENGKKQKFSLTGVITEKSANNNKIIIKRSKKDDNKYQQSSRSNSRLLGLVSYGCDSPDSDE